MTSSEENGVVLDSSSLSYWLLEEGEVITRGIFNIPLMCVCLLISCRGSSTHVFRVIVPISWLSGSPCPAYHRDGVLCSLPGNKGVNLSVKPGSWII